MSHVIVEHHDTAPRDVVLSWHHTYAGAQKTAEHLAASGRSPLGVETVTRRYRPGERIDIIAVRAARRGR